MLRSSRSPWCVGDCAIPVRHDGPRAAQSHVPETRDGPPCPSPLSARASHEEAMPSRTRRRSSSLPGRYVTSGKPPAALEANEPIHKLSAKRPPRSSDDVHDENDSDYDDSDIASDDDNDGIGGGGNDHHDSNDSNQDKSVDEQRKPQMAMKTKMTTARTIGETATTTMGQERRRR